MGRNIALSVIFLMIGGTGFALPDWVNIYDFYGVPSSGSLDPATDTATAADTDTHSASHVFSTVPEGGFGPPTASFQIQKRLFSVVQPNSALQFKDRWLFDYSSGSHPPHRQQHHRRQWARSVEFWSFIGPHSRYRYSANVQPRA
jgi:hypothetical protein